MKLALILAAAAGAASAQTPSQMGAGDATRGKALYYQHGCYGCHGYGGQTGTRNLVGTSSPILASPQAFVFYLRQRGGFQPTIPSLAMPRFSVEDLPDQAALDIHAYVRSFKLDAPDPASVRLMRQIEASAGKLYDPKD